MAKPSKDMITMRNNIPIICHKKYTLLNQRERKLSKFFKCVAEEEDKHKKCFFSTDNVHKFRQHSQTGHQKMCCCYCRYDIRSVDGSDGWFETRDCDQLIAHLIQSHGNRNYQCNQCLYRANSLIHIQIHEMVFHYNIWSKRNSNISQDLFDDLSEDFCKVIVCKNVVFGPKSDPSVWLPTVATDLDRDLAENEFYCNFCDFHNKEVIHVFIHCIQRHSDLDVSARHRECNPKYSLDLFSDKEIPIEESEESESDDDVEVIVTKDPVPSFKTQCALETQPIPGLDGDYIEVIEPPKKTVLSTRNNTRRRLSFQPSDEDNYDLPVDEEFDDIIDPMIAPNVSQIPRNDAFSDDMNQIQANSAYYDFTQSSSGYNQPMIVSNPVPNTSTPKPIATSTIISNPLPPEIDLKGMASELGLNSNKPKKKNKFLPKPIEKGFSAAGQTYKEYRQLNGLPKPKRNGNAIPKPTPAVTYIPRERTDGMSEYLELLETPAPRRGIKARFETHNHFELTAIAVQNNTKDKNLVKCVLCDEKPTIRTNNVSTHLRDVHKTDSSLKCGYCDDFVGPKEAIIEHQKLLHCTRGPNFAKFIVPVGINAPIEINTANVEPKLKTTARKSTASASSYAKGGKTSLKQKLMDSRFMGPKSNDMTDKKRAIGSEARSQGQRVYNRSTHSSALARKRQKAEYSSDSEEDIENQNQKHSQRDPEESNISSDVPKKRKKIQYLSSESEEDMETNVNNESDVESVIISETRVQQTSNHSSSRPSVAKKSTAKPTNESLNASQRVILTEDMHRKYFCVFCAEGFIINDLMEAIEHYKAHLKLGYTCAKCGFTCVEYTSMEFHSKNVHKNEEMDFKDNLNPIVCDWIKKFLEDQLKNADLIDHNSGDDSNSTGMQLFCSLCVKAAKVCGMSAKPFDSLWKVKLHICKHFYWTPKVCSLCETTNPSLPNHPYVLMKHLIDRHFNDCENLHNISFRGQKAFNDLKAQQIRLIRKHYTTVSVPSSDIINAFFDQLMTELDFNYENQLKLKFEVSKEVRIVVERVVVIKSEPIDDWDKKKLEDKKDIKSLIKFEVKNEVKNELKSELKTEIKDEKKIKVKAEPKDEEREERVENTTFKNFFINQLYGEPNEPMASTSTSIVSENSFKPLDLVVLSSDDEC